MTVYSPDCSLKGHDCSRQRWLKGEELGDGCPAFCFPFHVFWCENKREKFKERSNLIQRCLSPNFCWRSRSANISWFRQLLLKLVGGRCCFAFEYGWWGNVRARHLTPDCTSPQRAHRLLKVCISLWLFHSVCCDAGTGGQPCVEIQALYSSRQLLEWVRIYQPVICAMPLPTPPPSPPTTQN